MTEHAFWHGNRSRKIIERIVVELELHLRTPAFLGNGDEEELTDMPLLTDLRDPKRPILLGTSLAGALRAAVRRWELGHFHASKPANGNEPKSKSHFLFGDPVDPSGRERADERQSPLIVDDALSASDGLTEIRDGVRLNPQSRTADDAGLYNGEYWQAGTVFPIRLELLISEDDHDADLKMAFAITLACLEEAANQKTVTLGGRKRRGFGVVEAKNWKFKQYDLAHVAGLKDWLQPVEPSTKSFQEIQSALIGNRDLPPKQGREFTVRGKFLIDGSLLIRSGTVRDDLDIDMVHLHSARNGQEVPILSGTALAGTLRTRCWAIAEEIRGNAGFADEIVSELFGPMLHDSYQGRRPHASRIWVDEAEIAGATSGDDRLIQSRVAIDRFTGGALDTALFDEQPVFGPKIDGNDVVAPLKFMIHAPTDAHIGLLLLALKDLATGDLPVGGEASVGRGVLKLQSGLNLKDRSNGKSLQMVIGPNGETHDTSHSQQLNDYVSALHKMESSSHSEHAETIGVMS